MKLDYSLQAETDEELEFVEQVAAAREAGFRAGLSEQEIARILLVFAQGMLADQFARKDESDDVVEESDTCPGCGEPIENMQVPGIGHDPVFEPCGCEVVWEDIPEELID